MKVDSTVGSTGNSSAPLIVEKVSRKDFAKGEARIYDADRKVEMLKNLQENKQWLEKTNNLRP